MKFIFNSHANKTHFHMKDFALGLVLKVRDFGTRKMLIKSLLSVLLVKSLVSTCIN